MTRASDSRPRRVWRRFPDAECQPKHTFCVGSGKFPTRRRRWRESCRRDAPCMLRSYLDIGIRSLSANHRAARRCSARRRGVSHPTRASMPITRAVFSTHDTGARPTNRHLLSTPTRRQPGFGAASRGRPKASQRIRR